MEEKETDEGQKKEGGKEILRADGTQRFVVQKILADLLTVD